MHSFKKIFLRICLIVAGLTLYSIAVRFAYQDQKNVFPYIQKELRENTGKIDTLFCGTSTTYRSFSPQIWDSEMGGCSFNIGTAAQPTESGYYLIEQEIKRNPVERVFLGISPKTMTRHNFFIESKERVFNLLDSTSMKLKYLWDTCSLEEALYMVYYPVRVDDYIRPLVRGEVQQSILYKLSQAYKDKIYPGEGYLGKGFFGGEARYKEEKYTYIKPNFDKNWGERRIATKEAEALHKVIQYCQEQGIEVIMVYPPISGEEVKDYGNVEVIHDYFEQYAKQYNIQFWDFSFYKNLKEEYSNDMFKDKGHMNRAGGEQFSNKLIEIYQAYTAGEDISRYFGETCPYYE